MLRVQEQAAVGLEQEDVRRRFVLAETRDRYKISVPNLFDTFLRKLRRVHGGCREMQLASKPIGGIVKTYGGSGRNYFDGGILVDSEIGLGTRFDVYLPRQDPGKAATDAGSGHQPCEPGRVAEGRPAGEDYG